MRYKLKRIYTWSPETAYCVGLIASDGCLQKDGRHIDLTSTDQQLLKVFNKAINKKIKISVKHNSSEKSAYRLQFSDVAFYDFLIKAGVTPQKSKTIGKIEVPDKYYGHFLRGVFDGDGTVYKYIDRRWKNSFMFYISFACASKDFLDHIHSRNKVLCGVDGGSIRLSKNVYTLTYAKKDTKKISNAMYLQADSLYLKRKFNRLKTYIDRDNR